MIKQFRNEYSWLSNMTPVKITYKGIEYASTEHAYMSAKSDDMGWKSRCADHQIPAKQIKIESRDIILIDDWDFMKLFVMTEVTDLKYSQEPFRSKLLATGDVLIEEGNTWNDTFWGVDIKTGEGKNHLGHIIMEKRNNLKKENKTSMLEEILESYPDEDFLKADGFDNAIIGVAEDFNQPIRLIYSVTKCIEILTKNNEMDYSDAMEHFTYNVSGGYVGEKTPIWCWDNFCY